MKRFLVLELLPVILGGAMVLAIANDSLAGPSKRARRGTAKASAKHTSSRTSSARSSSTGARRVSKRSSAARSSGTRSSVRVGKARSSVRATARHSAPSAARSARVPATRVARSGSASRIGGSRRGGGRLPQFSSVRSAPRVTPGTRERSRVASIGQTHRRPPSSSLDRPARSQATVSSSVSRIPPARLPRSRANTIEKGKARPHTSGVNRTGRDRPERVSDRWQTPSIGLTIGGRRDGYAGGIHFGRGTAGSSLYGALLYDRDHQRHPGRRCYPRGHYYHLYYPIRHFAHDRYRPWGGYTYTSVYYPEPYVYRFYDTDVQYVEEVREQAGEYDAGVSSAVEPVEGPLAPDVAYQLLTEADDTTLIGRGNAAFLAGRYDEAREHYVSALLADERDGYAKFLYALANFAAGDYDVAAMAVRRALLTTPELIDYPADVRALYVDAATLEVQLRKLVRFVEDHPRDRGAQLLLAYLYFAGGDPGRALSVLGGLTGSDRDDEVAALLRDAVMRVGQGQHPSE